MNDIITANAPVLFLAGMAAFPLLSLIVKARPGSRRARAAAEIAQVGTGAVSLLGRVLVTAGVIVGVQWVLITHAATNTALLLVVLGLPALVAAYTLIRALTVTEIRPSRQPTRGGRQ